MFEYLECQIPLRFGELQGIPAIAPFDVSNDDLPARAIASQRGLQQIHLLEQIFVGKLRKPGFRGRQIFIDATGPKRNVVEIFVDIRLTAGRCLPMA